MVQATKQGWLTKKDKRHFYTLRDCALDAGALFDLKEHTYA